MINNNPHLGLVRAALFEQSSTISLCPRIPHVGLQKKTLINLLIFDADRINRRWYSQLVLENVSLRVACDVAPAKLTSG